MFWKMFAVACLLVAVVTVGLGYRQLTAEPARPQVNPCQSETMSRFC